MFGYVNVFGVECAFDIDQAVAIQTGLGAKIIVGWAVAADPNVFGAAELIGRDGRVPNASVDGRSGIDRKNAAQCARQRECRSRSTWNRR